MPYQLDAYADISMRRSCAARIAHAVIFSAYRSIFIFTPLFTPLRRYAAIFRVPAPCLMMLLFFHADAGASVVVTPACAPLLDADAAADAATWRFADTLASHAIMRAPYIMPMPPITPRHTRPPRYTMLRRFSC